MRLFISYLCSLGLLLATLPAKTVEMNAPPAPEKLDLALVDHYFLSVKTVGELSDKVKPYLKPEAVKFLKSKIAGKEKTPIEIRKVSTDRYSVSAEKMQTLLEFVRVGFDGKVDFMVNKQKITFTQKMTINELWEKVAAALPKESASLIDFVLPKADAKASGPQLVATILVGAVLLVAGRIVFSQISTNEHSACVKYGVDEHIYCQKDPCQGAAPANHAICSKDLKVRSADLFDAARLDNARTIIRNSYWLQFGECKFPGYPDKLKGCLQKAFERYFQESNGQLKVPAILKDYFNVDPAHVESPSSNATQ